MSITLFGTLIIAASHQFILLFTYQLTSYGWAWATIANDRAEMRVPASYISDALRDIAGSRSAYVIGFRVGLRKKNVLTKVDSCERTGVKSPRGETGGVSVETIYLSRIVRIS